jgi:hypothetical protein
VGACIDAVAYVEHAHPFAHAQSKDSDLSLDFTKHAALQNTASVASLILTTEAMVAEAPKDDAPAAGGGMPGGMGGMGMDM